MKKWKGVNAQLAEVEKTLADVGDILSAPFHDRVRELIKKLSKFKGVKINHLVMGMGGWSIDGTMPYAETFKGETLTGDHEIDLYQFDTGRNCWLEYYEAVNPGICEVCAEINKICEILTNTSYLQIFDISDKEMKKLLEKA